MTSRRAFFGTVATAIAGVVLRPMIKKVESPRVPARPESPASVGYTYTMQELRMTGFLSTRRHFAPIEWEPYPGGVG